MGQILYMGWGLKTCRKEVTAAGLSKKWYGGQKSDYTQLVSGQREHINV